jgi:cysteine desulfurase
MYGPKGVGALYVRRPDVRLEPLFTGGGQERGLRSGTVAVPLVVGIAAACRLCAEDDAGELARKRDRLEERIRGRLEGVTPHGHPTRRLPGSLNLGFAWVNGPALLMNLRGIAVSTGSACTSADAGPSYVLRAMGVEDEEAQASLRFGLGRFTTDEEVDRAAEEVVEVVHRLRESSPAYEMHRFAASRT